MTTRIQHLGAAWSHLREAGGCELEVARVERLIQEIYSANTEDLEGRELIDRLDDYELATAIAMRDPRIKLFESGFINPEMFNYIRRGRTAVIHEADQLRAGVE